MHPTRRTKISQIQKVHALLLQIPPGRVSSYAALARALQTSPRAIGGALRRNPFAPEVASPILSFPTFHPYHPSSPVSHFNSFQEQTRINLVLAQPCHRCIAANGFIGGFFGDWEKAPSGQNQTSKLALLRGEGVEFDEEGMLVDDGEKWFEGFEV
jgi:methylated-DNA-[protein]-cysteine S-methyltransferase